MAVNHATTVFQYLTWCSLVERAKIFLRKLLSIFFLKEEKKSCTLDIHAGISKNMVSSDENLRRRKSEYCNLDTKSFRKFFPIETTSEASIVNLLLLKSHHERRSRL